MFCWFCSGTELCSLFEPYCRDGPTRTTLSFCCTATGNIGELTNRRYSTLFIKHHVEYLEWQKRLDHFLVLDFSVSWYNFGEMQVISAGKGEGARDLYIKLLPSQHGRSWHWRQPKDFQHINQSTYLRITPKSIVIVAAAANTSLTQVPSRLVPSSACLNSRQNVIWHGLSKPNTTQKNQTLLNAEPNLSWKSGVSKYCYLWCWSDIYCSCSTCISRFPALLPRVHHSKNKFSYGWCIVLGKEQLSAKKTRATVWHQGGTCGFCPSIVSP